MQNEYEKNFACNPSILDNIDINNFLSDITTNYQKYKGDFIKVTGKVSRITGTKELELKSYIDNNDINGHVDFLDGSNVIISLNGLNVSNYKIYDYIKDYNEDTNTIILIDPKIEEKNLYKDYTLDVVEASNCDNTLKEYTDNLYTYCVNNIYLDYKIAKYELSYAIKDGKITIDDLLTKALNNQDNIYNYDKFNILKCNQDKYIIYKDNIEHNICN